MLRKHSEKARFVQKQTTFTQTTEGQAAAAGLLGRVIKPRGRRTRNQKIPREAAHEI